MSDKKNLVLITGQIRKPKEFRESKILDKFGNSDVYVCTNIDQSDNLKIANLNDNIFFIEDNKYQKNLQEGQMFYCQRGLNIFFLVSNFDEELFDDKGVKKVYPDFV